MRLIERILRRGDGDADHGSIAEPAASQLHDESPVSFHELCRQLESDDAPTRREAASLLAALTVRSAVRPLLRSYLRCGDPHVLDALESFGDKLTLVAGRAADDPRLSTTERARVMTVLGASGDEAAKPILRAAIGYYEPAVHVAACAALAELGDASGVELLSEALLSIDPEMRRLALRAALESSHPGAARLKREHVDRYLSAGGAVPANVAVAMPLLLDPDGDPPRLVAAHALKSPHSLTMVIGPEAARMSELHRDLLVSELAADKLFFTTSWHSPDEQLAVLSQAVASAARHPDGSTVLVGPLPSPQALQPPPHFLVGRPGQPFTARVIFVGQQEFAVVMEWWYYIEDESEVDTDFEVVLTALTIGGDRMTEEERLTYEMTSDFEHDAFARALLAHRAVVGDALQGRSWLY